MSFLPDTGLEPDDITAPHNEKLLTLILSFSGHKEFRVNTGVW